MDFAQTSFRCWAFFNSLKSLLKNTLTFLDDTARYSEKYQKF